MPRRGFARDRRSTLYVGVVLTALVPALLSACTAGPSARPAVVQNDNPAPHKPLRQDKPVPLPGLEEPTASNIDWSGCNEETRGRLDAPSVPDSLDFSCAKVSTTLDAPGQTNRGVQRIGLLKVGNGPIPLAVLNDIDGEPGTLYAAHLAATLPPEMLSRFSLIGIDRRGSGASEPIRCIPSDVRAQLVGTDPKQGAEPLLDSARTAGQQCSITLENNQGAYDSWRAAGDLDEIREQLGLKKIHAIARGEGSQVLSTYSVRFADHVGRFVLDGIPDPNQDDAAVLGDVAAGLQSTLDAFGTDCATRGCALGVAAKAAVSELSNQLRASPLPTPDGSMGPATALYSIQNGLKQRERWPDLADAISAARAGDATKLAAFSEPMLGDSYARPSRLDGAIATTCNDSASRLPPDQIDAISKDLEARFPEFGPLVAQQLAWCGPWPARQEPLPPPGGPGSPPILVTSSATDPATPEQGTARAAEQMPSAVRVAWQGAGHGAVPHSKCATEAMRAFLIDGTVPKDGTMCPA